MNIKHPELLYLLVLLPAAIAFFSWLWNRRMTILRQLCDFSKLDTLFPNNSKLKVLTRYVLLFTALAMIITALISPRWGYEWQKVETKGTNIFVALDLSDSMLADDIKPSRLVRAKMELTKLIDKLQGDRLGLILFAGESFMQAPLTHDYQMIKTWLGDIDTDYIQTPGTSVANAIGTAIEGFKFVQAQSKVLLIISDGEEHDAKALELAKRAKAEGIQIYTVGIGTNKGSPIRLDNGSLVKDKNGSVVVSSLNDILLKEIAEMTDAKYIRSTSGDFHINKLYFEYIKELSPQETLKSGKTRLWYESYQIFAAIALLCLLLEMLLGLDLSIRLGFRRLWAKIFKPKEKNMFEVHKLKNILLIISLASISSASANVLNPSLWSADIDMQNAKYSEAQAKYLNLQVQNPHNERLNYNLGVSQYEIGDYESAERNFEHVSIDAPTNSMLREKALYNLGNSLFKQEKYQEAVNSYEQALKVKTNDEAAKFNLELAKKLLEQQQDQNKDDQNDDDKNDDQNQDQEEKQDKDDQNKDQQDDKQDQDSDAGEEPKPELSQQDIDNLLKQVSEPSPQEVEAKPLQQQKQKSPDQTW